VREGARSTYRPTVHYAYHPCDDAVLSVHEFAGKNWQLQKNKRLMMDEITSGIDELGVLLMGHARRAPTGTARSCRSRSARKLVPHNNATEPAGHGRGAAGMVWAIENPNAASSRPMRWTTPGLEICAAVSGRGGRQVFRLDAAHPPRRCCSRKTSTPSDPWQFKNFRVV
jgi:homospermidine synthase